MWIRPAPLVPGVAVLSGVVLIWAQVRPGSVRGEDAQCCWKPARRPYPLLWGKQADRSSLEQEGLKLLALNRSARSRGERTQISESCGPKRLIAIDRHGRKDGAPVAGQSSDLRQPFAARKSLPARSVNDLDRCHRRLHNHREAEPEGQEHLGSSRRGDVPEVDHLAPAEPV